jgi:RNA polymerase sigma factor (sigma-70 family)
MRTRDERDVSLMALDQYVREVKRIPKLTREEEAELIERVERGKAERVKPSPAARVLAEARQAHDRLIEGYQWLVIYIACKYQRRCRSMDLMDLVQEGNVGLMEAIEDHDPSKGRGPHPFRAMLTVCIRRAMLSAIYSTDLMVRLPDDVYTEIFKMRRAERQVEAVVGREATLEEVASAMQVDAARLSEFRMLIARGDVESMQVLLAEDGDAEDRLDFGRLFAEAVGAEHVRQAEYEQAIQQALETVLTARQREVVQMRYGLDGPAYTQPDAARVLGISAKGVHIAERRAKDRLRQALAPVYDSVQEERTA